MASIAIVCPKCDASFQGEREFEAHMHEQHSPRAALGFGHTMFP